jgi:SNF2 family DNA or RNA helicase
VIRISHRGGPLYALVGPWNETVRDVCKSTPGMQWSPIQRAWIGYSDAVSVTSSRLKAENIEVAGNIKSSSASFLDVSKSSMFAICYESLRDYQRTGVEFLVDHAREGCVLADDMALGKTIQSIRAARAFKDKTVVVCPSFVKNHWLDELKKWWPSATTRILSGVKTTDVIDNSIDVVIANFDILHAWLPTIIAWGAKTLIVDELHYLMTPSSRRTNSSRDLARTCNQRIGLTGTPKPSHVKNLWAAIDVLSESRFGKTFFGFGLRYCNGHQVGIEIFQEGIKSIRNVWDFNGSSHEEELKHRLSFFMLRRLKSEVSIQLPSVMRQIIELEVKSPKFSLSKSLQSDRALRKSLDIAADAKIPQVVDLVRSYVEAGRKVVCFSYRKAIAAAIADGVKQHLKSKIEVVTGDIDAKKRLAIVASQPDLLCCTMDSLGVGVSLAYADVGIFAELHYVPSTLQQCEARLPRPDSKASSVLIVYAVARGTADDIIKKIVLNKMSVDEKVIGKSTSKLFDELNAAASMSVSEKMKRLYERLLKDDEEVA